MAWGCAFVLPTSGLVEIDAATVALRGEQVTVHGHAGPTWTFLHIAKWTRGYPQGDPPFNLQSVEFKPGMGSGDVIVAGWPLRFLAATHSSDVVFSFRPFPNLPSSGWNDAIVLEEGFVGQWQSFRVLPCRVLGTSFFVDTLFYAAIWGGVFFGFASAKRATRGRRRRGRCPRCGYDLRGNLVAGCSECGWNREESAK